MSDILNWSDLSPKRFEEFCADVLWALGFKNVRHLGASGDRGRDILCEREIIYDEQLSEHFTWLVQCKHTLRLDKASLANDLAAAVQHRPDVWWLMTSARVSPDLHDYLTNQSRVGIQPFRVSYLDSELLTRLCIRFPALIEKFLPRVAKNREHAAREAMSLMARRSYADAATLLMNSEHIEWCRSQYLLACCLAQSAAKGGQKVALKQAWKHLAEAINRNYLAYLHAKCGWPLDRCRTQVLDDAELAPLLRSNERKFYKLIGYSTKESSGGCLTGNASVCTPAGERLVETLHAGDIVTTSVAGGEVFVGRVVRMRTTTSDALIKLNDNLSVTPSQPVHTAIGWKLAGELQIGDFLTSIHGPEVLTDICGTSSNTVYNLTIEPYHQFYANGLLVHNKI